MFAVHLKTNTQNISATVLVLENNYHTIGSVMLLNVFLKQTYSGIDIIVLSSTGIREMSYWFYRKDKNGNKSIYAVNLPYVAIMPLLGMLAALLMTVTCWKASTSLRHK
jgi:hypothetical protein